MSETPMLTVTYDNPRTEEHDEWTGTVDAVLESYFGLIESDELFTQLNDSGKAVIKNGFATSTIVRHVPEVPVPALGVPALKGNKVSPGQAITYSLYPWGDSITAVVKFDDQHGNKVWIAQCTGWWKEFFDKDQMVDYVLLEDIGREIGPHDLTPNCPCDVCLSMRLTTTILHQPDDVSCEVDDEELKDGDRVYWPTPDSEKDGEDVGNSEPSQIFWCEKHKAEAAAVDLNLYDG